MLVAGSSFNLFPISDFILTQENIDNLVTDLNYVVERDFPSSLVSTSDIYNAVASPEVCHNQFYQLNFSTPEVFCRCRRKCSTLTYRD